MAQAESKYSKTQTQFSGIVVGARNIETGSRESRECYC
jgi:hypothetical protein